jgi:MFS transporter, DHA1 family, tetracycline resistance protein
MSNPYEAPKTDAVGHTEPATGARKASLGAIFLTIFLDLLGFGLVLPFLGEEARDTFGTTEFQGSLLAAVYSFMQFLFVPVWGRVSDRVGRRPVLLWSVLATGVGMLGLAFGLGFTKSVLFLFVARAFSGIATANLGTASAYIADVTKPEDRAKGMGIIGIAFGLGFIIGPAVGGMLAQIQIHGRNGVVPCLVAAGLSGINFLWILFGLPESLKEENRAQTKRRLSPMDFAAAGATLAKPGIGVAVLVNFSVVLSFTLLDQTFRFFTKDTFGMNQKATGMALGFIGICAAIVQGGVVRPLAKRGVPEALTVRVGIVLQAAGFAVLANAGRMGQWSVYLSGLLLAFGNGLVTPSLSAYISKNTSASEQGSTLGVNQSFSSLARTIGPAFGGYLYGSTLGHTSPYVISSLGMALALVIAMQLVVTRKAV